MGNNVERVGSIEGPASALYGAAAMGGVVNVITRNSTGDWAVSSSRAMAVSILLNWPLASGESTTSILTSRWRPSALTTTRWATATLPNSNYSALTRPSDSARNLNESWRLVMHGDTCRARHRDTRYRLAPDKTNKDMDRAEATFD